MHKTGKTKGSEPGESVLSSILCFEILDLQSILQTKFFEILSKESNSPIAPDIFLERFFFQQDTTLRQWHAIMILLSAF